MKKYLIFLCIILTCSATAQFLEMGPYANNTTKVPVYGKDANGILYGTKFNSVYTKTDDLTSEWSAVASGDFGKLAIPEVAGFKMYSYYFGIVKSSVNGTQWQLDPLNGIIGEVFFVKYLDNNSLIISTEDKSYISYDGGFSFEEFLEEKISVIQWDYVNNRFAYIVGGELRFKENKDAAEEVVATSFGGSPSIITDDYYMSVTNNGSVYATSYGAFSWIYHYDALLDSSYRFYPASSSAALYPRGIFSTKTGRTFFPSWGKGLQNVEDDARNNYSYTYIPGLFDSYFVDQAGYLYLNTDLNSGPQDYSYSKSTYSMRQPVFFQRMYDVWDEEPLPKGNIIRRADNTLLSITLNGKVFTSSDDGDTWQNTDTIIDLQGSNLNEVRGLYKHPSGHLWLGTSGIMIRESDPSGLTWDFSPLSSFAGTLQDVAFNENGSLSFFLNTGELLLSTDTGKTAQTILQITTNNPAFGQIAGLSGIEYTDANTLLVTGIINSGNVYRSVDTGATWQTIMPIGMTHQNISDIFEDASSTLWIATSNGLLYSNDDGVTWTKEATFPEASAIEIAQDNAGRLIVTGSSTYMLKDGEWLRISYGATAAATHLYVDPQTDIIFVGSNRKSIEATPTLYTSLKEIFEHSKNKMDVIVYPNPSSSLVYLENKQDLIQSVKVYNLMGKLVHEQKQQAENKAELDVSSWRKGLYLIQVNSKNQRNTTKLMVN